MASIIRAAASAIAWPFEALLGSAFNLDVANTPLLLLVLGPLLTLQGLGDDSGAVTYSKFGKGGQLPSRLGMLLIYGGAFAASWLAPWLLFSLGASASPVVWMLRAHFSKRVLEVLLVHVYSGHMSLGASVQICAAYTTMVLANLWQASCVSFRSPVLHLGVGLFCAGLLINAYHHWLLRRLRLSRSTKEYVSPSGGLFAFVCCPHYLGELVAFLGFALASTHAYAYYMAIGMTGYLARRSHRTLQWYKKEGLAKPGWKRLIPFVW